MSETQALVRRPISVKIFGIAVVLLVLMIVVTISSSLNLRRLGQQLNLLSDYFIELDQQMSDLRAQTLREVIQIERVLALKPKEIEGQEAIIKDLSGKLGDCSTEGMRPVMQQLRKTYTDRGQQQLMVYRITRLCTDARLKQANALVEKALTLEAVRETPEQLALFTTIKGEMANIPPARLKLNEHFEKYQARLGAGDAASLAAVQDQIDERRLEVNRRISAVTKSLHDGTRQSADLAERLESRTQVMSWTVTAVACILGLVVALLVTRNLVRPVRELLGLTQAIRAGNLDIKAHIRTGDEIGLLADSFNHMVGEMREKEQIKNMFGKYVDPRIVQGLLLDQGQLSQAGERRHMSVFFSDLEGFTTVCEGLTPTAAVRLLNQYFSLMSVPIREQHGIIDKYIGDSIMAFWGPPFSTPEEHALQACRAALAQKGLFAEFEKLLPEAIGIRKNLPKIRARMGIATGDVTVGTIGSEESRSYTVIGDSVNLASRLEGANKLYRTSILISDDTWRMAREQVLAREIDAIRVVGKDDPIAMHELLAMKNEASDLQVRLASTYATALGHYRKREWEAALRGFAACMEIQSDDGPSVLFIERIGKLKAEGVPADWDGVWNMTQK